MTLYPLQYIQLETTNRCNLRCVICPHWQMVRPTADVSEEVIAAVESKILRQRSIDSITLSKDGEPLLYPGLLDLMKRWETSVPAFDIFTNGLRLTEEFLQSLSNLTAQVRLLVTFHYYNANGKKNDYEATSKLLQRYVKRGIAKNVNLVVVLHVSKLASEADIADWSKTWNGVTEKHPEVVAHVNRDINTWAGMVPDGNITQTACPYQDGRHLFIGVTGNVIGCCVDLEERNILGNIVTDSFEQILETRDLFYAKLVAGECPSRLCSCCLGRE